MMAPAILATEQRATPCYLRCDCCRTPVAEIRAGCLVIQARHDGQKHVTIIPLAALIEALERAA